MGIQSEQRPTALSRLLPHVIQNSGDAEELARHEAHVPRNEVNLSELALAFSHRQLQNPNPNPWSYPWRIL